MKSFFKPLKNKYFWRIVGGLSLWLLLVIIACNVQVNRKTAKALYDDLNLVPACEVGLLLGTNPYLKNGLPNKYFLYRIEAAVQLYQAKKIQYILVSGDNHRNDYNEPEEMKKALIKKGIPETSILMDYAGFRTLDSVVRAKTVFGKERFMIISQRFHNERALYLAEYNHIKAVGFNAQDVTAYYGLKTRVREYLARLKLFIDLWFEVNPKFLK
ncbi:SanA family protein [Capnocytophaga sp. oral taxon 332 str. F0381]|jgi:sanA protein|uniref:SanA/YdcF family protein n=1 Tax=Capnocytophaga sp. oral taxon 332 TaxID=712213 RepID=UPI0002A2417D|nr:ElyC/SanA/YdcF family protein [Capnocytophaga sp. oral taxon 332]EKY08510.1 SanA family protein [Capnocytophaga sp. oral taxon 332 str. F0381]